ncbi:sex peptide receptor-like [Mizuhopecten yessoensis]|uniref:FMRFamide receptor n=1 Tax=Mizuhopecten yessoensis TaxID=6573 RepID=A0A210QAT6_MIZYE|nr:sex peptide receptor-like [Mizuhopecten yessoensis]OWF45844.1 FMRFamide receptor [Mizuhopecten yessoensis]
MAWNRTLEVTNMTSTVGLNVTNSTADGGGNFTQDEYYYYYYYNEPPPYQVRPIAVEIPFKGFVYPVLAIVTILGNILTVSVFIKERMRTATSVLLICLAVSDSVICASLLPNFLYLYPTGNFKTYVMYGWCVALQILSNIYRVARTTSNWITAAIGLQRYIIVRLPFKAKRICTIKTSLLTCVFITIASLLIHLLQFLALEIIPSTPSSTLTNGTLPTGCIKQFPVWIIDTFQDMKRMVWMHYLFTGIFSGLLPCLLLLITTVLLVLQLRRRRKNLGKNGCHGDASDKNTRRVTRFVIVILIVFLLAEMQDAVAFFIYVYEISSDKDRKVLSREADMTWDTFTVLIALLSYHVNFWIYLLMSKQFRCVLRARFCPRDGFRVNKRDDRLTTASFLPENSTSQMSSTQKAV